MNNFVEQPIEFYQADLIDYCEEYLTYKWEGWIFAHGKDVSEDVKKFIAWCREDDKKAMHCKRSGDGKSFYERRETSEHLGRSRTEK
jgi:hypothetical protein